MHFLLLFIFRIFGAQLTPFSPNIAQISLKTVYIQGEVPVKTYLV